MRDGHAINERTLIEKAVLSADIMSLPDLSFYIKLANFKEFCLTKMSYITYNRKNIAFISLENDDLKDEIMKDLEDEMTEKI